MDQGREKLAAASPGIASVAQSMNAVISASTLAPNGSGHSPMPKSSPQYQIPTTGGAAELQSAYRMLLGEFQAAKKKLEDATGMKFILKTHQPVFTLRSRSISAPASSAIAARSRPASILIALNAESPGILCGG